jgi:hypothetical protein
MSPLKINTEVSFLVKKGVLIVSQQCTCVCASDDVRVVMCECVFV